MTFFDVAAQDLVAGTPTTELVLEQERAAPWRRRYLASVVGGDVLGVAAVVGGLTAASAPGVRGVAELAAWPAALFISGTYNRQVLDSASEERRRVMTSALVLLAAIGLISTWLGAPVASAGAVAAVLALPLLALSVRAALRTEFAHRRVGRNAPRTLLVGSASQVSDLTSAAHAGEAMGTVVGAVLPDGHDFAILAPNIDRVFFDYNNVRTIARELRADTVVVASGSMSPAELRRLAWSLEDAKVDLVLAPGLLDVEVHRLSLRSADGLPLLHVASSHRRADSRSKRVLDLVGAAGMLLVLTPLILAIAAVLKLTDPGPIFFTHRRVGRNGEPFALYKLRTMRTAYSCRDPIQVFRELGREDLVEEFREHQKVKGDPRVSRVGLFLRRSSLDELPQLWNVLRGELSLVGPRPVVDEELERFGEHADRILACRPGMTGLWQVSGRNDIAYAERTRFNLYYVDNWRLRLDLQLLLRTIRIVARRRGAC